MAGILGGSGRGYRAVYIVRYGDVKQYKTVFGEVAYFDRVGGSVKRTVYKLDLSVGNSVGNYLGKIPFGRNRERYGCFTLISGLGTVIGISRDVISTNRGSVGYCARFLGGDNKLYDTGSGNRDSGVFIGKGDDLNGNRCRRDLLCSGKGGRCAEASRRNIKSRRSIYNSGFPCVVGNGIGSTAPSAFSKYINLITKTVRTVLIFAGLFFK